MSRDSTITIANVIKAIDILHNKVDSSLYSMASVLLVKAKRSPNIFEICDQLLYMKKDLQTTFFAATTLKEKVQRQFEDIPLENRISFKDSMMTHVKHLTQLTEPETFRQLCLVIANLFVQMLSWEDSLDELITTFYEKNEYGNLVLLTILKYIPEEMKNDFAKIGLNRRTVLESQLFDHRMAIIHVLNNLSNTNDQKVFILVLHCFVGWMIDIRIFVSEDISKSQIIEKLFSILKSPEQVADEVYKECCSCISLILEEGEYEDILQIMLDIFRECFSLEESYKVCVSKFLNSKVFMLARVFSSNGEFVFNLLTNTCYWTDDVDLEVRRIMSLLFMVAKTNMDCALFVFEALNSLMDFAYDRDSRNILLKHKSELTDLLITLNGYFVFSHGNDNEKVTQFRHDMSVLIKEVPMLFDCEKIFNDAIMNIVAILNNDPDNYTEAEASIYTISCVVKFINTSDSMTSSYIMQLLDHVIIPNFNSAYMEIKVSSIILISQLDEWLHLNVGVRDKIFHILVSIIMDGNSSMDKESALIDKSIKAISKLCESDEDSFLVDHFQALYMIASRLDHHNVDSPLFYHAVGSITINSITHHPAQMVLDFLKSIFAILKTEITQTIGNVETDVRLNNLKYLLESIKESLDMFPDIGSSVELQFLMSGFSEDIWPFLSDKLKGSTDEKSREFAIDLIKSTIKFFGIITPGVIFYLCDKISTIHVLTLDINLIDLAIVIINIFYGTKVGNDSKNRHISTMATVLLNSTLKRVDKTVITENEQLLEVFFHLLRITSEKDIFRQDGNLGTVERILNISLTVLSVGTYNARMNTIKFIHKTFSLMHHRILKPKEDQESLWLTSKRWGDLLKSLLTIVATDVDIYHDMSAIDCIADIIRFSRDILPKKSFKSEVKMTLREFPRKRNDGLEFITNCQLNEFIHDIINKYELTDAVKSFGKLYQ